MFPHKEHYLYVYNFIILSDVLKGTEVREHQSKLCQFSLY